MTLFDVLELFCGFCGGGVYGRIICGSFSGFVFSLSAAEKLHGGDDTVLIDRYGSEGGINGNFDVKREADNVLNVT